MFEDINGRKVDKAHLPAKYFKQYFPTEFDKVNNYFTFGFVRNPYSRVISAYNEVHKADYLNLITKKIPFSVYCEKFNEYIERATPNLISSEHLRYRHTTPQNGMFYVEDKSIADLIIKVEDISTAHKKLEFFNQDIAEAAKSWAFKKNNTKSSTFTSEEILTRKAIKKINELFEADFHLFGYKML